MAWSGLQMRVEYAVMPDFTVGQAVELLGVSVDTVRHHPDHRPGLGSRRARRLRRLAAALPLALAACATSPTTAATTTTAAGTTITKPAVTGTLKVFAAASLTSAFNSVKTALTAAHRGLDVTYNFAGSNALVAQIQQGAPADVFASADRKNMTTLVTAGVVGPPVVFARNKLEIAVAPGNPKRITDLADLAKPGVAVVLEAPGVPAGDYTRQVETKLGITITPKSLTPDVKTAITSVTAGEVDATVVYVTDVHAAGSQVTGVAIPDSDQPTIVYPIAVVKATHNPIAAQAFVQSALSGDVQKALEAQGFIAP